MSNTYTRILLHVIFAVKNRDALLPPPIQPTVHRYIASVLRDKGNFVHKCGGIDNHIHVLFDYNTQTPLPDLIREVKIATTKFINDNRLLPFRFAWQKGYSCFSHSPSQLKTVSNYIENQSIHHKGRTLTEEIINAYEKYGIKYDSKYIFENINWD